MAIWTLDAAEQQSGIKISSPQSPSPEGSVWDLNTANTYLNYEASKPQQPLTISQPKQVATTPSLFEGFNKLKENVIKIKDAIFSFVPKPVQEELGKVRQGLSEGISRIKLQDLLLLPKPVYAPEPEGSKGDIKALQQQYEQSLIGKFDDKFQTSKNSFIKGLTGGIIKPKEKVNPDLADKIIAGVSEAVGTVIAIENIGTRLFRLAEGSTLVTNFIESYPRLARYTLPLLKNIGAFSVYGQLDPDLKDRFKKFTEDVVISIPFTALGFVEKATYSIPASFGLGFGLAKLSGASNEDAFVSGAVLGILDGWGRMKGKVSDFVKGRQTDKILRVEALKVLNEYSDIKVKLNDPIEKINEAYRSASKKVHPDITGSIKEQTALNSAYEFLTGKSKEFDPSIFTKERYTPQEIINEVIKNGYDKTEEGKKLIKGALEAENKNQDIVVSLPKEKPTTTEEKPKIPPVITKEIQSRQIQKLIEDVPELNKAKDYVSAKDFADAQFSAQEINQIGKLSPDKIIARDSVDEKGVEDYIKMIQNGEKIDPIEITKQDNKFITVDGSHRLEAFRSLNKEVPVIYRGKDKIDGLYTFEEIFNTLKSSSPSSLEVKSTITPEQPPQKHPEQPPKVSGEEVKKFDVSSEYSLDKVDEAFSQTPSDFDNRWNIANEKLDKFKAPLQEKIKQLENELEKIKSDKSKEAIDRKKEINKEIENLQQKISEAEQTLEEKQTEFAMKLGRMALQKAKEMGLDLGEIGDGYTNVSEKWQEFRDEFVIRITERPYIDHYWDTSLNKILEDVVRQYGVEPKTQIKPETKPEVKPSEEKIKAVEKVKPEIPPELESLAQEARKYKSAEEFVKKVGSSTNYLGYGDKILKAGFNNFEDFYNQATKEIQKPQKSENEVFLNREKRLLEDIPLRKSPVGIFSSENLGNIVDAPNYFTDVYLLLTDRYLPEVEKWKNMAIKKAKYTQDYKKEDVEKLFNNLGDRNELIKIDGSNFYIGLINTGKENEKPYVLLYDKNNKTKILLNSEAYKWLRKEGYDFYYNPNIAYKTEETYSKALLLKRDGKEAGLIMPIRWGGGSLNNEVDKIGKDTKIELYGTERNNVSGRETGQKELPSPVSMGEKQPGNIEKSSNETGKPTGGEYNKRSSISGERSSTRITPSQQQQINAKVEALLKEKGDNPENYTNEDKKLLEQYTGSGGLAKAGVEERGVLDEYYTPQEVVDFTWKRIKKILNIDEIPKDFSLLEPAVGTGRFIKETKDGFGFEVYEINPISAKITKILYPKAYVENRPFESIFVDERGNKLDIKGKTFDIIVGNPPYGEHRGFYLGVGEEPKIRKYEEYFLKRGIDLLDKNGILAYVMPSSFLDNSVDYAKEKIGENATLIEAFRLPRGIFGTTDIGTDIVIFKKGGKTDPLLLSDGNYFTHFPSNILGEVEKGAGRFGEDVVKGTLEDLKKRFESILSGEPIKELPKVNRIPEKPEEPLKEGKIDNVSRVEQPKEIVRKTKKDVVIESTKKDKTIYLSELSDKEKELWRNVLPGGEMDINYVQKLLGKDITDLKSFKSDEIAVDPLVKSDSGLGLENKFYPNVLYYSGNIYEKLDRLEQNKDLLDKDQYEKQKKGLLEVLPKPKKVNEIKLKPNDESFVKQLKIKVKRNDGSEELVDIITKFKNWLYDLPREAFENSSEWEVKEYIDGKIVNTGDKIRNIEIRRRRREIGDKLFNRFLNELSDENKKIIEDSYNRLFNAYVKPDYKKIPLLSQVNATFKGKPLKLKELQKEGISFLTTKGVGLLAYEVGLGKTMTTILSMNEMMNRGWVKRPLIIVPNSVYYQWLNEIQDLIPNVKINSLMNLGKKFNGKLSDLKIEDGTISLMSYEGMSRLGFRMETYNKLMAGLQDVLEPPKITSRQRAKLEATAEEYGGKALKGTTGEIFFEDLGFDGVIFDEVHSFKNIFTGAKIERRGSNDYKNVRGSSSSRGVKAYFISQYILNNNNGRNVFGLSATPFSNHPLEIYSILSLFGKKKLEQMKLKNVNDFMSMFMDLKSKLVLKANQEVKEEDVIENFTNLGQLQKLITEYISFETGDNELQRPIKDKRRVILSPTKEQVKMILKAQPLFKDKEKGGTIVAITELQNITLSPYLSRFANDKDIQLSPPTYENFVNFSPKIKFALDSVAQNYKNNKEANQIIYMPRGVEYYPLLKEYLVKKYNIKPSEIEFVSGGMDIDEKYEIQNRFNKGQTRILIGSEAILIGMNLQEKTTDLFHLHLPWNPTDIQQIEGRLWRQGNQWSKVRIHYPLIENSVDSFIFQKLETKEKRIKNIWSYTGQQVEVGDLDFENMKMELITDPVIRVQAEKEFAMSKLEKELAVLKSERAFAGRQLGKVNKLKKDVKDFEKWKQEAMANKNDSDVIYWGKRLTEAKAELNKELEDLRKKGVNVDEIDKKIKEFDEKIKVKEEEIKQKEQEFEQKLQNAKKERINLVAKENDYNTLVRRLAEENKTFFVKRSLFTTDTRKAPSGYADVGGYSDIKSPEKIISDIKAVDFPEILRIAKNLLGKEVKLSSRFKSSLGAFYPKTFDIKLSYEIFKKPELTAKVLAHELGHLADFLPDKTMARGNLVGRIATLQKHLKNLYGELDNKVIKDELKNLTQLWKPFDENANPSYTKYRYSSSELYADAISVLFNDPVLLKEKAPRFWEGFFEYLDKKPEVMENFNEIWNLLNEGEDAVFKKRDEEIDQMFSKAEEKFRAKYVDKQMRNKNLAYQIRVLFDDVNRPIIERINKLQKEGKVIPPELNPEYALKGLLYSDAEVKNFIEDNLQPAFTKAREVEDGWNKLGKILFYERVINERGELANPLGYDQNTASFNLKKMEEQMSAEDWQKLQEAKELFREGVKKVVDLAEKEGYYTPETLKEMKMNPAYATFQVIEYLDTYVSPRVYHQTGTLKEISNPATATVMKLVSTYKAIKRNEVKKLNIEFLKQNFSGEIEKAKTRWNGKSLDISMPKDENLGLVITIENGKPQGWYVPKDVAETLNWTSNSTLEMLGNVSRAISQSNFYRPLFTVYNLGFQTFNFVRDLNRAWKNYPHKTLEEVPLSPIIDTYKLAKGYIKAVKPAFKKAFGLRDELIREMENANILGLSYNDVFSGEIPNDQQQIERILEGYGLFAKKKKFKILSPIINVLETVEKVGEFIETLPKVAAYVNLKGEMPPEQLAEFIRTSVGSPAFRVKGRATPITNSIFLFSNAIKEGLKTDLYIASGKRGKANASSFWYKTFLVDILPGIFIMAMSLGYFGDKLKKIINGVSEYDKTNYIIIPIGLDENGRSIYGRIPRSETGRFIGGLFWKTMNINKDYGIVKSVMNILSFGAGQLPNLSPIFIGLGALISYLSGNNPYDFYRDRPIIPEKEFKAGFNRSFPILLDWLIKSQGLGIALPSYNPKNPTSLEKFLSLPLISNIAGRWIKVSNQGLIEQLSKSEQSIEQKKAERYLEIRDKINDYVKEYQKNPTNEKRKELERKLLKDFLEKGSSSQEKTNLIKRFRVAIVKGKDNPYLNSLIYSQTNDEKVEILKSANKELSNEEFRSILETARKNKIIGSEVIRKLRRQLK